MKYRIVHESTHRIRIRMFEPRITAKQEEILLYAFSAIRSVRKVTVFRDTAGVAFDYEGDREEILSRLDASSINSSLYFKDSLKPSRE